MIFGVYHLVSYVSRFMSLQSGDIITTGTPPGVGLGKSPPRFSIPATPYASASTALASRHNGWSAAP